MKKTVLKIKSLQPIILLLLGLLLLLIGRLPFSSYLRVPFSYIFEPVSFVARDISYSVSNWSRALFDASMYIEEYRALKEEVIELKATKENLIDYEEYNALKENSSMVIPEYKYVASKVLGMSDKGDLYINTGIKDGLKEGDVVSVGNTFVGVISSLDRAGSLVRLPINRMSTYEVVILPANFKEINNLDGYIKSRAVITGSLDGIRIENIGANADVSDGDIVVIRDERIGELLIVGRLVALSRNPAATSKSGFVSPSFDYANLLTVFVRID